MSGRILIIDSVATNRIVLKAKVMAAQYQVDACASCAEAQAAMAEKMPDMVLINLSDPTEDRHSFCRAMRSTPQTAGIPILSVGSADSSRSRFAALDAGADDVLPRPISDVLLLARIRSLLRRRNRLQDLQIEQGTKRALGFDEDTAPKLSPTAINIVSDHHECGVTWRRVLQKALAAQVRPMTWNMSGILGRALPAPDLFVIDATQAGQSHEKLFELVSDLRARSDTRGSAQLILVPQDRPEVAAMVLDLGADDVAFAAVSEQELALRASQLIAHKKNLDTLRDGVRSGLQAAVTDPLTGLYNRRYAETQMGRIADRSNADGSGYAVMMLDIDHFKSVNDTHGHAAGDMVLRELSDRLRKNLRGIDLLARVGGEEFLIAMPDTTRAEAELAAERLRKLATAQPFPIGAFGPGLQITVSVGVAVTGDASNDIGTPAQIIAQADRALYSAKADGRNKIAMSMAAA